MAEASPYFFILSILALLVIAAVFAMRYAAAVHRSRLEAGRRGATDEALDALRQDVGALAVRVNAIEKLLREVE